MSFSPQLLAAARDAAPVIAKLTGRPGAVTDAPAAPASPQAVAWIYLRQENRPHGLAKQLAIEHAVDYGSLLAAISRLRSRHCIL